MLNTTTNQLNNITNSLSTSKPWRKTENQPSRTSLREAELQQKLKQSTLRDKENVHTSENKKLDIQLTEAEVVERKKIFAKCNFYLDNIEGSALASIERGIKILGAVSCKYLFSTSNTNEQLVVSREVFLKQVYSSYNQQTYTYSRKLIAVKVIYIQIEPVFITKIPFFRNNSNVQKKVHSLLFFNSYA